MPEIRKLCVVKTYINIEEVVVVVAEIERVLEELKETSYEPMKEKQYETMSGKSTTNQQLHVLNETFINFFGKGIDGKARPSTTFSTNINNRCKLYHLEEHTTSTCLKLVDTRLKCAKCGGGHKIDNFGLKCSFCFGLGHAEDKCWEEIYKGFAYHRKFPTSFG